MGDVINLNARPKFSGRSDRRISERVGTAPTTRGRRPKQVLAPRTVQGRQRLVNLLNLQKVTPTELVTRKHYKLTSKTETEVVPVTREYVSKSAISTSGLTGVIVPLKNTGRLKSAASRSKATRSLGLGGLFDLRSNVGIRPSAPGEKPTPISGQSHGIRNAEAPLNSKQKGEMARRLTPLKQRAAKVNQTPAPPKEPVPPPQVPRRNEQPIAVRASRANRQIGGLTVGSGIVSRRSVPTKKVLILEIPSDKYAVTTHLKERLTCGYHAGRREITTGPEPEAQASVDESDCKVQWEELSGDCRNHALTAVLDKPLAKDTFVHLCAAYDNEHKRSVVEFLKESLISFIVRTTTSYFVQHIPPGGFRLSTGSGPTARSVMRALEKSIGRVVIYDDVHMWALYRHPGGGWWQVDSVRGLLRLNLEQLANTLDRLGIYILHPDIGSLRSVLVKAAGDTHLMRHSATALQRFSGDYYNAISNVVDTSLWKLYVKCFEKRKVSPVKLEILLEGIRFPALIKPGRYPDVDFSAVGVFEPVLRKQDPVSDQSVGVLEPVSDPKPTQAIQPARASAKLETIPEHQPDPEPGMPVPTNKTKTKPKTKAKAKPKAKPKVKKSKTEVKAKPVVTIEDAPQIPKPRRRSTRTRKAVNRKASRR